jgi:hypothetical protein
MSTYVYSKHKEVKGDKLIVTLKQNQSALTSN